LPTKYHEVIVNEYTRRLGFLCRVINFLEDVLEDSECTSVLVDSRRLAEGVVVVDAVECSGDVRESTGVFREKHGVRVELGPGDLSLWELYDRVVDYYSRTLRKFMKNLVAKTIETGVEYYLGVLFDGRGFVVEGYVERVAVPGIPQCFSAHTHPADTPWPSPRDLRAISRLLLDRGVCHVIEARNAGLAIYRRGPLTIEDYEALKLLEKTSGASGFPSELLSRTSIRARYI